MRPIHLAKLDKTRPVLVLTREQVRPYMGRVTVAPITTTIRGLSTEVPVGKENGLDQVSVVSCDNIVTVLASTLGRQIGYLLPKQERKLSSAITLAFDLDGALASCGDGGTAQAATGSSSSRNSRTAARPARFAPTVLADGP